MSLFPPETLPSQARISISGVGGGDGVFPLTDETLTLQDLQLEQHTVMLLEECAVVVSVPKEGEQVLLRFCLMQGSGTELEYGERNCIELCNSTSLGDVKSRMMMVLEIEEEASSYRLRKTNWAEELGDAVEKEEVSVAQSGIQSGDLVVLEKGAWLKPGHMLLTVWEHVPEKRKYVYQDEASTGGGGGRGVRKDGNCQAWRC